MVTNVNIDSCGYKEVNSDSYDVVKEGTSDSYYVVTNVNIDSCSYKVVNSDSYDMVNEGISDSY